jgi:hypothetical protein
MVPESDRLARKFIAIEDHPLKEHAWIFFPGLFRYKMRHGRLWKISLLAARDGMTEPLSPLPIMVNMYYASNARPSRGAKTDKPYHILGIGDHAATDAGRRVEEKYRVFSRVPMSALLPSAAPGGSRRVQGLG